MLFLICPVEVEVEVAVLDGVVMDKLLVVQVEEGILIIFL